MIQVHVSDDSLKPLFQRCSSLSSVMVVVAGGLHTQLVMALTLIVVFVLSVMVLEGRCDIAAILGEDPSEASFQSWCICVFLSLSQVAMDLTCVLVQGCFPSLHTGWEVTPFHVSIGTSRLQCW